jgi:DSF synthase
MNRSTPLPFLSLSSDSGSKAILQRDGYSSKDRFSAQLRVDFDQERKALWLNWAPRPRPCFNVEMLEELAAFTAFMQSEEGDFARIATECTYLVLGSDIPGVFNLGGDLDLFIRLIESKDRTGLVAYGKACIDVLHSLYRSYDCPLTTIALIQGHCFGGGFEAALACDIRVAEQSAVFCFPETLFGLWPGMGAWSFLLRKPEGQGLIELLSCGKRYSAREMQKLGLVDVVVEDGAGKASLQAMLLSNLSLSRVRSEKARIDYGELWMSINVWANCALELTEQDRKLMRRFVGGQNQLGVCGEKEGQPGEKAIDR